MMPPHPAALALRARLQETPLTTSRLRLRLPRPSDAVLVFEGFAQDLEATRWLHFKPHEDLQTTERVVARWLTSWETLNGQYQFVIERQQDQQFVGSIRLGVEGSRSDTGYTLCKRWWGQGYASEALRAIVDLAFTDFTVWRLSATCAPENIASQRVMEKAGMTPEGRLRRWVVLPGVSSDPHDVLSLAIPRDDWLAAQAVAALRGIALQ